MPITQLTTNGKSERPDISGNNIVWIENDNNDDVILFDGTTSTVLPDLGLSLLSSPQISPDGVFWKGNSSGWQFFFYDGTSTSQLTTNQPYSFDEKLSGNRIAWRNEPNGEHDHEVFVYDDSTQTITQLTTNTTDEYSVDISGSNVVWRGVFNGVSNQIILHNGVTTTQLTQGTSGYDPHVSGNQVVWRAYDGGKLSEIYLYDGNTTTQLVDSNNSVPLHGFFDGNVVWSEWDGNDWELFRFDGTNTTQITDNSFNDVLTFDSTATSSTLNSNAAVDGSGNNLVWSSEVSEDNWEVFFYDGSQTIQVTNDSFDNLDPKISGNTLVWNAIDGVTSNIFKFEPDPDPDPNPDSFEDNFDPDIDNSQWQEISNGTVNSNFGGSGNSLFFTGGSSGGNVRFATSQALDLTAGGFVSFDLIFGNSTNGGEDADPGMDVALEYSTNDGNTWTALAQYDTEDYTSWSNLFEAIPTAAKTSATHLRWRQINQNGSNLDNWGLDNVELLDAGTNFAPSGTDASFSLDEHSSNGMVVGTVMASDPNPGQILTYSIQSGNDAGAFAIDATGQLTIIDNTPLDYETIPSFNLEIEVSDNGTPSLSDTVSITVDLIDIDEGTETMADDFDPDIDNSQWQEISNGIVNSNFGGSGNSLFFTGGSSGGNVRFARSQTLDLTAGGFISFDLIFGNSTNGGEDADPGKDVILEYSPDGIVWTAFAQYDTEDYTSWSTVIEAIPTAAQDMSMLLRWRQIAQSGSSFDNWGLDNVELLDAGTNFAPSGTDATFSLDEHSPNSTVVGTVVASDPNPEQILTYSIQSGNDAGAFAIDSNGQITVIDSTPLDYETTPSFNLEIEVSDNGSPSLSDTVLITVDLIDINEGTGTIADDFDPDIDNSQWQEISNGIVNTNFGGSGNSLFFTGGSSGGNSRFATSYALDLTSGGLISFDFIFGTSNNGGENADSGEDVVLEYSTDGTTWTELALYDTEDYSSWSNLIETIPTAAQTASTFVRWRQINHSGSSFDNWGLDNVELLDPGTNYAPSGIDATFSLEENSPNSTVVGTVVASDPNPGQILTYSIQSGNDAGAFAIDSNGQITVIDSIPLDYETTPSFNLEIEVSDNGSPSLSDTVSITVDLIDVYDGTGTIVVDDDLDFIIDDSQWLSVGNTLVNSNFSSSDGNSFFFTGGSYQDSSRYVTTNGVNVANGGGIYFDLIFGTSSNGGENADFGEDVVLEYSTDYGASWTEINRYDTEDYTSWTGISESIPVAAQTNNTQFQWLQVAHNGSSFDNWGLDNVLIEAF